MADMVLSRLANVKGIEIYNRGVTESVMLHRTRRYECVLGPSHAPPESERPRYDFIGTFDSKPANYERDTHAAGINFELSHLIFILKISCFPPLLIFEASPENPSR